MATSTELILLAAGNSPFGLTPLTAGRESMVTNCTTCKNNFVRRANSGTFVEESFIEKLTLISVFDRAMETIDFLIMRFVRLIDALDRCRAVMPIDMTAIEIVASHCSNRKRSHEPAS